MVRFLTCCLNRFSGSEPHDYLLHVFDVLARFLIRYLARQFYWDGDVQFYSTTGTEKYSLQYEGLAPGREPGVAGGSRWTVVEALERLHNGHPEATAVNVHTATTAAETRVHGFSLSS